VFWDFFHHYFEACDSFFVCCRLVEFLFGSLVEGGLVC